MSRLNTPIGMVRHDELVNILNALILAGGCDVRTLFIVAKAVGVQDYIQLQPSIIVEGKGKNETFLALGQPAQ